MPVMPPAVRSSIEAAAALPDPQERTRILTAYRRELDELAAITARGIHESTLQEQGADIGHAQVIDAARADADIRDELLRRGLATDEQMDTLGYPSHDMIDEAEATGDMAPLAVAKARLDESGARVEEGTFQELKHKRGRGGKFADEHLGPKPLKGRGGKALPGKPTPKPKGDASPPTPSATTPAGRPRNVPDIMPAKAPVSKYTASNPEAKGTSMEDAIDVGSDVNKAADLLSQGKHVRLDQQRTASVLLDELHARVQAAKAAKGAIPNFDLCRVSVPNSNLFCAESKGILRIHMPQLSGVPEPGSKGDSMPKNKDGEIDLSDDFRKMLADRGVQISDENEKASMLRPSQIELNGAKVAGMTKHLESGGTLGNSRIFTSSDGYIVDGHHRWAAYVGAETSDKLPAMTLPIARVDMDIIELLAESNKFAKEHGIKQAGVGQMKADPPKAGV